MKKGVLNRYIFVVLVVLLAVLAFMIAKPFVSDLLTAMILAYVFYPVYRYVQGKIKNRYLSSFIVIILLFLIIALPLLWIANSFYGDVMDFVDMQNKLPEFLGKDIEGSKLFTVKRLGEVLTEGTGVFSKVYEVYDIVSKISASIVHFFISLFMTFFLLKDGDKLVKFLKDTFRFKTGYGLDVAEIMQKTIHGVIYGVVVVAIIQGLVAMAGYGVLSAFGGIKNPFFWGVLTILAAFIPTIGTGLVWFPMSIYLGVKGILFDELSLLIMGIALLIYGSLVIGTIDNFIRPKIIGDKAQLHPIIVLMGVLGGLGVFGFIGIIIGPLVFALAQEIIVLYKNNKLS